MKDRKLRKTLMDLDVIPDEDGWPDESISLKELQKRIDLIMEYLNVKRVYTPGTDKLVKRKKK